MTPRIIQLVAGEKTSVVLRIIEKRAAKIQNGNFEPSRPARFADLDLRVEWVTEKSNGRPVKIKSDDLTAMLPPQGYSWSAWQVVAQTAGCPRSTFRRTVHKAVAAGLVVHRDGTYFRS